ncbi:MAG: ABC transporter ATP-binding protein [Methylococcaceae bacterium]|nr:ABC transporter ATP-binding protein [Methylococcaceae bacterium]MCI0732482.1 ABC transporter ATP-binding protein [Methylococcaceae bacterium]
MIEAQNLTKFYDECKAVDDVSFQIGRGEIVGLLGHNGAGKTTIMKMLTGYLEASAGSIVIDNLDISEQRADVQKRIGYLPENCPLYPDMNVIDFLDYAAGLKGLTGSESNRAVRAAIDRMELRDKAGQTIQTLSRGYRQRVGVAQAILTQPAILILDEPTNGLDPSQIQHMRDMIIEMGTQSTVILSTHILREVQAVCDRVLIIREGRLAMDSRIEDLEKGQRLLLAIDRNPADAKAALSRIDRVTAVEFLQAADGRNHYALEIDARDRPVDEYAAPVARAVLNLGYQFYGLHVEKRDLEHVFSEINARDAATEEESHAA